MSCWHRITVPCHSYRCHHVVIATNITISLVSPYYVMCQHIVTRDAMSRVTTLCSCRHMPHVAMSCNNVMQYHNAMPHVTMACDMSQRHYNAIMSCHKAICHNAIAHATICHMSWHLASHCHMSHCHGTCRRSWLLTIGHMSYVILVTISHVSPCHATCHHMPRVTM